MKRRRRWRKRRGRETEREKAKIDAIPNKDTEAVKRMQLPETAVAVVDKQEECEKQISPPGTGEPLSSAAAEHSLKAGGTVTNQNNSLTTTKPVGDYQAVRLTPATVEEQPAKVTTCTTSEDGSVFVRVGYDGDAADGGTQRTSHSGEETVQGNPQSIGEASCYWGWL